MKRDKNYRMSGQTKRILSTIADKVERNRYKNAMIDAQLTASIPYKSDKPKKQ